MAGVFSFLTTGAPTISKFLDFGTDIYTQKVKEDAIKKSAINQKRREVRLAEERRLALIAARSQNTLELAMQLSQQRRREQQTVLIAVGGIAVLVSGLFLAAALRRRSQGGR